VTVTVATTKMIDSHMVELEGAGPRGGKMNWTVRFKRNGDVLSGYQWEPPRGFLEAHEIPPEVKEAARKTHTAAGGSL